MHTCNFYIACNLGLLYAQAMQQSTHCACPSTIAQVFMCTAPLKSQARPTSSKKKGKEKKSQTREEV